MDLKTLDNSSVKELIGSFQTEELTLAPEFTDEELFVLARAGERLTWCEEECDLWLRSHDERLVINRAGVTKTVKVQYCRLPEWTPTYAAGVTPPSKEPAFIEVNTTAPVYEPELHALAF